MNACFLSAPPFPCGSARVRSNCISARRRVTCTASEPPRKGSASFVDKLFSAKLFKSATSMEGPHAAPLVVLRVMAGVLMLHHGSEGGVGPANFGTAEFNGFVDYIMRPYFGFLPGNLELWAAVHDYVEFFGGALLAVGALTRPAALALTVTMGAAVYFHLAATGLQGFPLGHVESYSYNFEEPLLYLVIFFMYFMNGAGALSLDSLIYEKLKKPEEVE